jgi:hypothetical protein
LTLELGVQHKPNGSQYCGIVGHQTIGMTGVTNWLINLGPNR